MTHTPNKRNSPNQNKKKKGTREIHRINRTQAFKHMNTYLSIITLNFNGLNPPIKRQDSGRLDIGGKKPTIGCL